MSDSLKLIWAGDLHLNASPPGWRTDSYAEDVLTKVEWLMLRANQEDVEVILWAGDMFHSKRNVPIGLIADLADLLGTFRGHHYILPGNHDLVNNDLDDVDRRPVGLLARMPRVGLLRQRHFGPVAVYGVPYVHGLRYDQVRFPKLSEGYRDCHRLLCIHYGVTPTAMPYETLLTDHPDWNPFPGSAGYVFTGHIHDDLGVWKDRHGNLVFNLGALTRGSLTEHNLQRQPRVLYSEWAYPDKPKFKGWDVPVRPADEVFRLGDAEAVKSADRLATEFLAELGSVSVKAFSREDVIGRIEAMTDIDPAIRSAAVEAVMEVWE